MEPADFEDQHLKNTIAFIERTGISTVVRRCLAGDQVLNHALEVWYRDAAWGIPDAEDPNASEPPMEYLLPIYGALVYEARQRGLDLEPPKQIQRPEN